MSLLYINTIEFYDLSKHVHPKCKGFSGAIFDGRYVYFIPMNNGSFQGQVTRFDTHGAFKNQHCWSYFDTTTLNPDSKGFINGAFDGRYIYFAPFINGQHFGQVTRYDTKKYFTSPDSWNFFNTTKLNPNSKGFVGAIFDGRYVYFVPYQLDPKTCHGQVTRYDTHGKFEVETSWDFFDMTNIHPNYKGYHAALFDGRYIYFIPYISSIEPLIYNGNIIQLDTHGNFLSADSWSCFNTAEIFPKSVGFIGGTFDGQYLYFAPYHNGDSRYGQVVRYNSKNSFNNPRSWDAFDTTIIHENSRGFFSALYDGRFVYFVPHCRGENLYHGQITRYDTKGSFTSVKSWTIFDTESLHENNKGFISGTFDGKYIYFAPYETEAGRHSGQVIRFSVNNFDYI